MALLLILDFVITHKLTNEAASDLINTLLLQPSQLPSSTYKLYKILKLTDIKYVKLLL